MTTKVIGFMFGGLIYGLILYSAYSYGYSTIANGYTPAPTFTSESNFYFDDESPCTIGLAQRENFLPIYTVESGDSLSSIAVKTLGDATRAEEIKTLNRHFFTFTHSIDEIGDSTFLEVGWKLLIPPVKEPTEGMLSVYQGEIVREDNDTWSLQVTPGGYKPGYQKDIIIPKNDVQFFGDTFYTLGSCVNIINDHHIENSGPVAISPQDRNYFNTLEFASD